MAAMAGRQHVTGLSTRRMKAPGLQAPALPARPRVPSLQALLRSHSSTSSSSAGAAAVVATPGSSSCRSHLASQRIQQQQQQQQQQPSQLRFRRVACQSSSSGGGSSSDGDSGGLLTTVGLLALWGGLLTYVFVYAPNQTPNIDAFTVLKLANLKPEDPYQVNPLFAAVWNAMGLYPLIYASLLIPGARTNKVPAWPFVVSSVFMGAYALIPFMALWSPKSPPEALPPPKEELEGWNKLFMKGAETPWLPAGLAVGAAAVVYQIATVPSTAWLDYVRLFDESRLVHATSLDFALLTLLAPFWMSNDAAGRKWGPRETLVPLLACLPLLGPSIYLFLRPKTFPLGGGDGSGTAEGSSS